MRNNTRVTGEKSESLMLQGREVAQLYDARQ